MQYILFTMPIILILMCILFYLQQKKAAIIVCICGFIPVVGVFLMLGYYLIKCLTRNVEGSIEALEEQKIYHIQREGTNQVEHLVAVSEALALNDTKIKKEVLIGVLREDKTKYIETLKSALQDKDVEASHYAAVALMNIKDNFQKEIEKCVIKLKKNPDDIEALIAYEAVLEKSILSGLYDAKRLKHFEETYSNILARLIAMEINTYQYYHSKIKCEMRLKNFRNAYKDCMAFKAAYEESEMPYLCFMEYYYLTKDYEAFCNVVEEVRVSTVTLSRTGIQNIRFWLGGMV